MENKYSFLIFFDKRVTFCKYVNMYSRKNNYLINNHHRTKIGQSSLRKSHWIDQSIYILCLSVYLSVCLHLINVTTAESIGPQFFLGPHMTQGKFKMIKFQKFASNSNIPRLIYRWFLVYNPWLI